MNNFLNYFLYFFIYSFGGWICECIYCSIPAKKFINRGFLYGPYCPIYGFGALIVTVLLDGYLNNPVLVFFLGMLLTSLLEYVTSFVMEKLFNKKWWDYSHYKFNINGRVCLLNSALFGIMSLFVIYVLHPEVSDLINLIPLHYQAWVSLILFFLFAYDLFNTIKAQLRKNKDIAEIEDCLLELRQAIHDFSYNDEEPLSLQLQAMFDSTDADERLKQVLERVNAKFKAMQAHQPYTELRLSKAFPNQIVSERLRNIRNSAEVIKKKLEKWGE